MNRTDFSAGLNQPSLRIAVNAYRSDPLVVDLTATLSRTVREELEEMGSYVTSHTAQELARMANQGIPQLRSYGPGGERIDAVEFHPAWHALMRRSMHDGLHCSVWDKQDKPEMRDQAHKMRAARLYLVAQLESGHLGSLMMTNASVAALMTSPRVQKDWVPKILSRQYDSSNKPPMQKTAVTVGIGITEKQGGSDIRETTSSAEKVSEGIYRLSGHKWFLSAPMSDAFIMLAKTVEGVCCFIVPRLLEDGSSNGLHYQRLKDKVGNRSNATVEVEFFDTFGFLLGTPGSGLRHVLDMATLTRLDCALISSGGMRTSLAEAVHYARRRLVFGKLLIDQPIMKRVLADMALDVAAATALSFRLADAFDRANTSSEDAAYARIITPVAKYWCCKIAPALIAEVMECVGGSGYVEERPIARQYRDSPANAIWEGAGNFMALDVLHFIEKGRDLFDQVFSCVARDLGAAGNKTIGVLKAAISLCEKDAGSSRFLIEQMALAAAAAELYRLGAGRIADAFLETRLAGGWRSTYGMLGGRFDSSYIIDLLYPDMG